MKLRKYLVAVAGALALAAVGLGTLATPAATVVPAGWSLVEPGVTTQFSPGVVSRALEGGGLLFQGVEVVAGRDLNGDGDTGDGVWHLMRADGTVTNLGLASTYAGISFPMPGVAKALVGGGVAFVVSEPNQGVDLNGNGSATDRVVHVWNASTGVVNLGVSPQNGANLGNSFATPDGGMIFVTSAFAFHRWTPGSAPVLIDIPVPAVVTVRGTAVVHRRIEADESIDFNNDGDLADIALFELDGGVTSYLGYAGDGSAFVQPVPGGGAITITDSTGHTWIHRPGQPLLDTGTNVAAVPLAGGRVALYDTTGAISVWDPATGVVALGVVAQDIPRTAFVAGGPAASFAFRIDDTNVGVWRPGAGTTIVPLGCDPIALDGGVACTIATATPEGTAIGVRAWSATTGVVDTGLTSADGGILPLRGGGLSVSEADTNNVAGWLPASGAFSTDRVGDSAMSLDDGGFAFSLRTLPFGSPLVIAVPRVVSGDDGDGIAAAVDTLPAAFSSDASDGTTSLTITNRGGLTVSVTDAAPGGLRVGATGPGGPATLSACGYVVTLTAGDDLTLTCGSIAAAVATGPVEIAIPGGGSVAVPSGSTARLATVAGESTIEVQVGSVTVVSAEGVRTTVAAGVTPAALCRGRVATIVGTPGDDRITATNGADVIVTGDGDDRVDGRGGDDVICGGRGNDRLEGGPGADQLDGGDGDDRLEGGSGNDLLVGGAGDDRLEGGGGDDRADGGPGTNRCEGIRASAALSCS